MSTADWIGFWLVLALATSTVLALALGLWATTDD